MSIGFDSGPFSEPQAGNDCSTSHKSRDRAAGQGIQQQGKVNSRARATEPGIWKLSERLDLFVVALLFGEAIATAGPVVRGHVRSSLSWRRLLPKQGSRLDKRTTDTDDQACLGMQAREPGRRGGNPPCWDFSVCWCCASSTLIYTCAVNRPQMHARMWERVHM